MSRVTGVIRLFSMLKLNTNVSTEELLKSYLNDGIITVGDVRVLKMEDLKQMIIDKVHKYSITKQKDGRWSTYIPDQTKPAGRRLIKRKSKADLNKFLLEFYHLRDNASLMTFGELFSKWVEYKKQYIGAENRKRGLSPSTIRRYERDFDHYIKGSKLDKTLICEITRISLEIDITSIIKRYDMLEQNASNLIGYICQAMLFARRSEYITVNPAETIDKALLLSVCRFNPPKDDSERVLTLREYHELYEAVLRAQASHPEYMPNYAIELAMLTGMRVGEIAALHWSDIDEDFIHIDFSEHRLDYSDRKSELVIDEPKNGKHRVVQMTEKIKAVFGKIQDIGFTSDENFVFCRKDGMRYTGHDISCACDRRAKEAGIKKTSIHGIRRTMSSMLNTILPEKAVADMLGHTERVNERHYNYCMAENAEKKAALDQVYSKVFKISDYQPEEKKTGSA